MKTARQIFINLLLYSLFIFALLIASTFLFPRLLSFSDILLPGLGYPVITALSLLVFKTGYGKPVENQPLFTMGAVGLKFFLSMVFALIYFVVFKNTGAVYVLLFFLLYLAFTIYLLRFIYKALKTKSLK
ncbi:MAG: hypothetical protein RQ743_02825 [Bacteroidales bacterium]|nr:hypothetical protein [Bacteroidales bacterium]